jgi:hypothetical protein
MIKGTRPFDAKRARDRMSPRVLSGTKRRHPIRPEQMTDEDVSPDTKMWPQIQMDAIFWILCPWEGNSLLTARRMAIQWPTNE